MKKCSKCLIEKDKKLFYKNSNTLDRLSSWCKECSSAQAKAIHKQTYKPKLKKIAINIDHKYCTRCDLELPNTSFKRNLKLKSGLSSWCVECDRQYDNNHSKNRLNKLYANDPHYKWVAQNRQDMRNLLYRSGLLSDSFEQDFINFFGCTIQQFKDHIESKFQIGMNWSNYGKGTDKWSIDHIKPMNNFEIGENPNNYLNLQPLWYSDNSRKGCK